MAKTTSFGNKCVDKEFWVVMEKNDWCFHRSELTVVPISIPKSTDWFHTEQKAQHVNSTARFTALNLNCINLCRFHVFNDKYAVFDFYTRKLHEYWQKPQRGWSIGLHLPQFKQPDTDFLDCGRFVLMRKGVRNEWRLTPVRFETADSVSILEGKSSLIILGVKHLHVFRHCILQQTVPVLFHRVSFIHRVSKIHRPSLGETVCLQHRAVSDAEISPSVEQHDHKPGVQSHAWATVKAAAENKSS